MLSALGSFSWCVGFMDKEGLGQKLSTGLRFKSQLCLVHALWTWPNCFPSLNPHFLTYSTLNTGRPQLSFIHILVLVNVGVQLFIEQLVILGSEDTVVWIVLAWNETRL